MGSGSSKSTKSSNGNEISDTKQPWFSAKDLLESIADGWMVAGGVESMRILNTPGALASKSRLICVNYKRYIFTDCTHNCKRIKL